MTDMASENLPYKVHSAAICDTDTIGAGTHIGAFSYIQSGAKIGKNCAISSHVVIEDGAIIGANITVGSGVSIPSHMMIADNVQFGANVSFYLPVEDGASKTSEANQTEIHENVIVGANATIQQGIIIERHAIISPGSVVTGYVPPFAVVSGNPGIITGYQTETPQKDRNTLFIAPKLTGDITDLGVGGAAVYRLPSFGDSRGDLAPVEFRNDLPFKPERTFLVHNVPSEKVRGEHAHKECQQFLVAVSGSISVVVDNVSHRAEVLLDSPTLGLLIPPMVWGIQYKFTADAALLVYASHPYDNADYVRSYNAFSALCAR